MTASYRSDPAAICFALAFSRRAVMAGALSIAAAWPATAAPLQDGSIEATVARLKPGEFLWAPEVAPVGPVLVVVSLERQRAYVYRNGVLIGISTASTGAPGHETPTGVFTILQKDVDHRSNLYNDAPMPFMQRLTWGGVAMHAGNLPGYPASHGCIRLPHAFAKHLFGVTKLGFTVIITADAEVPRFAPTRSPLDPADPDDAMRAAEEVLWRPEQSPSGPISLILSAADRRLVVLRNGILIGSAPVELRGQVAGIHAFSLASIGVEGLRWMHLAVLGEGTTGEVTPAERDRIAIPGDFRQKLRAILTVGTTLVVTADSLRSASAGSRLTVIEGDDER